MSDTPRKSREDLLEELWGLTVAAAIKAMSADAPGAAAITAARQLLADSGVNLDSLPQLKHRRGLGGVDYSKLPLFSDDGDSTDTEAVDPLHADIPFAPVDHN